MKQTWVCLALAACSVHPAVQTANPGMTIEQAADLKAKLNRQKEATGADVVADINRQSAMNKQAWDACNYQAAMANATTPGGLVRQSFSSIEVQSACLQYYQSQQEK